MHSLSCVQASNFLRRKWCLVCWWSNKLLLPLLLAFEELWCFSTRLSYTAVLCLYPMLWNLYTILAVFNKALLLWMGIWLREQSVCCEGIRTWVWIMITYVKSQTCHIEYVTLLGRACKDRWASEILLGSQSTKMVSPKFIERPCLKK